MERREFEAPARGGTLVGYVTGSGRPVLLAHGGPGLGYDHLDSLVEELASEFEVAYFQQRGLAPSCPHGEFTVAEAVGDVVSVLDHLGWQRAWFVGHSWGGHLGFHVAEAIPDRLHGVLAVDPLGAVGDGGADAFWSAIVARLPPEARARVEELDAKDMDGTSTPQEQEEEWDLIWPAYFADPGHVMPRPTLTQSAEAHVGLWDDLVALLPELEAGLGAIRTPVAVVAGAGSPMPADLAAARSVERIPGARLERVEGAGHFVWWERPGSVRDALLRMVQEHDDGTREAPPG
ncbi:pimeloyl-ACP methyl ester carboxylesterase [Humibacillus xanthopallidus]|uniref:Pimeloyl-ACP methyl ester carboxylesterase n=1 Tax=Humibacillus xanthopallidus TaxID=412689 RepID=A0A543PM73_9MICO|nr:alpha/beta hydrolase [Humibacillus xanthopallidus]TQN45180.1 pimeloyl-ACP methyl ester carboxylesterase [Humibacillus xanthopallidus]